MEFQFTRSRRILTILLVTTTLTLMAMSPRALSQVRSTKPDPQPSNIGDGIPESATESNRGRALVEQLRRLRRTESTMGKNHPGLEAVREEIERTEKQLQAWLPQVDGGNPSGGASKEMNADELRKVILRMAVQIQRLEFRVDALEKRLEVF